MKYYTAVKNESSDMLFWFETISKIGFNVEKKNKDAE